MHKSKLAGFIIDCETDDLVSAAQFWGDALGVDAKHKPDNDAGSYVELGMRSDQPYIEVQSVSHESRVHLDIETDDIPAEVSRLEALGATTVSEVKTWVVMQSPTGQRFCVVPVGSDDFDENARSWGNERASR